MLEPGDIEQIRSIIREEIEADRKRMLSAERSRRYRERKRHAAVTLPSRSPEEDRHAASRCVTPPQEKNGDAIRKESSPLPLPLFPSHTLPITPSPDSSQRTTNPRARGRTGPLMSNAVLETLSRDPLYKGIDLVQEAFKFERWCQINKKANTVRRFVNWINNPR